MQKNRLEAFSDGVLAIIITIFVLELKVPHGDKMVDLLPLLPTVLSYVLSFLYVGIYWNNHHHLLHSTHHVNGAVLWANLHLLFWLSLLPFASGWLGENHFAAWPTAVYGVVLLMAAVAYWVLTRVIVDAQGPSSNLEKAIGGSRKEALSAVLYAVAIPLSFVVELAAQLIYVGVALMWLVPDRRIEKAGSV